MNALFKTHIELMRYDDVIIDCDIRVVMLATYLIKYKMLVRSKFMRIRSNFSWLTISNLLMYYNDINLITFAIWMKFHFPFLFKTNFLFLYYWSVKFLLSIISIGFINIWFCVHFFFDWYCTNVYIIHNALIWFHLKCGYCRH